MSAAATAGDLQVLEFEIGGKRYCVTLAHVDEIVNNDNAITAVPGTPPGVVGVMDLRGRTTKIVDPRIALDLAAGVEPKYVVVFGGDEDPTGWLIEDVNKVSAVAEGSLDETVANGPVRGVVKRDDGFVVWVDPDRINE
ncbi:MAG: chemotaxis protein CheW [Halodesulfurarchaeum sp.]